MENHAFRIIYLFISVSKKALHADIPIKDSSQKLMAIFPSMLFAHMSAPLSTSTLHTISNPRRAACIKGVIRENRKEADGSTPWSNNHVTTLM